MTPELTTEQEKWPVWKKAGFLFLSFYVLLYIIPYPPFPVLWFGKHILHIASLKVIAMTGSGDTTYHYTRFVFGFIASLLFTVLAAIIDYRRNNYRTLTYWLFVLIRFYVGFSMLGYGFAKISGGQFGPNSLFALEQTYGGSSPMALLWRFMGYSYGYSAFTGIAEVLAGVFLFFRKTTVLGALVAIGVMSNVLMLNLCYDVPVKLYSGHLLFFSLILILPDSVALFRFLVLNKPATLVGFPSPVLSMPWKVTKGVVKMLLFLFVLSQMGFSSHQAYSKDDKRDILNGVYKPVTFIHKNDTLPPLATDTIRWRMLIIEDGTIALYTMADSIRMVKSELDTSHHVLNMVSYRNDSIVGHFAYHQDNGFLQLSGTWRKDSVSMNLHKVNDNMPLTSRGFHWVNEYPYNQ